MAGHKHKYEFVKDRFEQQGYILLATEYKNNITPMLYVCPEGHTHYMTYTKFQQGGRCPTCQYKVRGMKRRIPLSTIKNSVEEEGYTFLHYDFEDKNRVYYICPEGHHASTNFIGWRHSSVRCPLCANNVKPTYEFIKSKFEAIDYELISAEYENAVKKLRYKCHLGHAHEISWHHFQSGTRCPTCRIIKVIEAISGPKHYNWKGGIANGPYCSIWQDKEYKEDLKERDGFICLNPMCDSNNPSDLVIHHVDYEKGNCAPMNLITLCRSCNTKANTDREWHKAWYQA